MNTSGSAIRLLAFLLTNPNPGVWPTPAFSELSPKRPARVAAHPAATPHEHVCRGYREGSSSSTPLDHSQGRRRNLQPSRPESGTSVHGHHRVATSSTASL